MAVVLYKKGDQQIINGLACDVLRLDSATFNGELIPGWFFSAEDAYKELEPEEVPEKIEQIIDTIEQEDIKAEPEETKVLKGNAKIRDNARKAGIEDWEKARISTLKEKLKA